MKKRLKKTKNKIKEEQMLVKKTILEKLQTICYEITNIEEGEDDILKKTIKNNDISKDITKLEDLYLLEKQISNYLTYQRKQ